tara:strand:+ start:1666 stop:1944 length:279 start_codon:yes stop_codon:yes gene_type:complete
MKTKDEAYEIICDLNDEAHSATWDEWVAADDAENEGEDMDVVEGMREDASYNQAREFREAFQSLDEETQQAILYWEKNDEEFAEEFKMWWGE